MTTTNQSGPPDDRLHREVDEILHQAQSRPISFQQKVEQKRNALAHRRRSSRPDVRPLVDSAVALLMKVPIVTALVFALVAAYLANDYGVLAIVFALAAVVMVFAPFAMRRPASSPPRQPRWRGQVVSNLPSASRDTPRSWLDQVKRRMGR